MPLWIRNGTPNIINVAVGYPNEGCFPRFGKRGWYVIQPGRYATVFGGRANTALYVYAFDRFGNEWGGPFFTDVPDEAFDMCWIANCTPCKRVGFFETRNASGGRQIILTLNSSLRKSKSSNNQIVLPTKRLKSRKYPQNIINKTNKQGKLKSANKQMIFSRRRKKKIKEKY
ncbi:DUF1036 domain-containing protein [Robertmurraya sp.]|uniref:DUF1036 domain-containing protein n=1 Tax=Robertmurraya sp. TaxID=2837525 RepID=UPI0037045E46